MNSDEIRQQAIEAHINGMPLRKCAALCASITEEACKINRKSGRVFSCPSCKGLGEIVQMGTKNIVCNEPGCTTGSWKGGKCWKHHPEHIANKKASREDKSAIRKIHKEAAPAPAVAATPEEFEALTETIFKEHADFFEVAPAEPPPPVTAHEHHIVNLLDVFKAKQAAELAAFADRLSEISDPVEKLLFVYEAVQV